MSFFNELRRRRVLRSAGAYALVALAVIETTILIGEPLGVDEAVFRALIYAAVIGLPPVVVFAWYYQVTSNGLRRQADIDAEKPGESVTRSKFDYLIGGGLVIALSYIVVSELMRPDPSPPTWKMTPPEPLVSTVGVEMGPEFSPDGEYVAYTWWQEDARPNIYLRPIDELESVQLTDNDAPESSIAWSPDSTRVAFMRRDDPNGRQIVIKPKLGGAEVIVHQTAALYHRQGLDWSPDEKSLLFPDQDPFSPEGTTAIFSLDLESGELMQVTFPRNDPDAENTKQPILDGWPKISPDGRHVAFLRGYDSEEAMCFLELPNGVSSCLRQADVPVIHDHDWLNDTHVIATYDRLDNGVSEVLIISSDIQDVRDLYAMPDAFQLSVAGDQIVISSWSMDHNLWRIRGPGSTEPGAPERITSTTRNEIWPHVSPSGEQIAFVSDLRGQSDLVTANIDGTGAKILLKDSYAHFPRWSPDGSQIAYGGADKSGTDAVIYAIEVPGAFPREVTERGALPTWSGDGNWLYFHHPPDDKSDGQCANEYSIFRQLANGGQRELVVPCRMRPIPGPNDRLYFLNVLTGNIESSTFAGDDIRLEVESVNETFWDVSQENLVYVDLNDSMIKIKNLASGEIRDWSDALLRGVPGRASRRLLSVSANDEWIVYTRQDDFRVDLKIAKLFLAE